MTKTRYDATHFDALAIRLLELAGELKGLGRTVREEQLGEFELHDRKPKEWLTKLEAWVTVARRKLREESLREQGARKAQEILARDRRRHERRAKDLARETRETTRKKAEASKTKRPRAK